MTATKADRRLWRCPFCQREYRIPAGAEDPMACPQCAPGTENSGQKDASLPGDLPPHVQQTDSSSVLDRIGRAASVCAHATVWLVEKKRRLSKGQESVLSVVILAGLMGIALILSPYSVLNSPRPSSVAEADGVRGQPKDQSPPEPAPIGIPRYDYEGIIGITVPDPLLSEPVTFLGEPVQKKSELVDIAKQTVAKHLFQPHTASYPWGLFDEWQFKYMDDPYLYRVSSYVESKNAFGATIRKNFVVVIRKNPETGLWRATHCGFPQNPLPREQQ